MSTHSPMVQQTIIQFGSLDDFVEAYRYNRDNHLDIPAPPIYGEITSVTNPPHHVQVDIYSEFKFSTHRGEIAWLSVHHGRYFNAPGTGEKETLIAYAKKRHELLCDILGQNPNADILNGIIYTGQARALTAHWTPNAEEVQS